MDRLFSDAVMACALCERKQRGTPGRETGWRAAVLDNTTYYVCPAHLPAEGEGTQEDYNRAWESILGKLVQQWHQDRPAGNAVELPGPKWGEEGYARVVAVPEGAAWERAVADAPAIKDGTMPVERVSLSELVARASDPTQLCLICECGRPGIWAFLTHLEHELFPPRSGKNAAFSMFPFSWEGFPFTVALLPLLAREEADRIAGLYGLRLYDGVPARAVSHRDRLVIQGATRKGKPGEKALRKHGKVEWFPIQGDNAFVIESKPGTTPISHLEEKMFIDAIIQEWEAKYAPERRR